MIFILRVRAFVLQMLFYAGINLTSDWAHPFIELLPIGMLSSAMGKIYVFDQFRAATDRNGEWKSTVLWEG